MNPVRLQLLSQRFEKTAADDESLLNSKMSINDMLSRLGGAFTAAGQYIRPAYDFANKNKLGIGTGIGITAGLYGLNRLFNGSPGDLYSMDDATALAHMRSRLPAGSSIYSNEDIAKIKRDAYLKAGLGGLAIGGSLGTIGGYSAGKRRASMDADSNLNSLRSAYSNPYDMYSQQRLSPYGDY